MSQIVNSASLAASSRNWDCGPGFRSKIKITRAPRCPGLRFARGRTVKQGTVCTPLARPRWQQAMTPRDYAALTPLIWSHVNPYGRFDLDMNARMALA